MHPIARPSVALTGCLVAALGGAASANAFLVSEHDARAVGRGNASAATDVDPSAIAYNVGGLAVEPGTSVSLGGALISPGASFLDPSGARTDLAASHPVLPHLFVTTRLTDAVAVGLGFHAPFGLDLTWPDAAPGAVGSSPSLDVVKAQALRTYFVTPSVGLNLGAWLPGLSLGGGLDLVPATVERTRGLRFGDTHGQVHLGGDAFGLGGRLGAMYRPPRLPALSLGAMWRSRVDLAFTGVADFDVASPYRGQLPPDGAISSALALPQAMVIGAAVRPAAGLELEANLAYVNWAAWKEIRIRLPDGTDAVEPQAYRDTFTLRLGAEYRPPASRAAVRVGYVFDPTPIPSTTLTAQLPDANRHDVTAGASYRAGAIDVHVGVLWVVPRTRRTSDAPGTPIYKGTFELSALVASLTVDVHFGR